MSVKVIYNISGQIMVKSSATGRTWLSLVEDHDFRDAIANLYDFVIENDADHDEAYNFVCERAGIDSFVLDTPAWDMFYAVYTQAKPVPHFECAHA